eukprot:6177080-Pleurochrysis_carterae.AAC.2
MQCKLHREGFHRECRTPLFRLATRRDVLGPAPRTAFILIPSEERAARRKLCRLLHKEALDVYEMANG